MPSFESCVTAPFMFVPGATRHLIMVLDGASWKKTFLENHRNRLTPKWSRRACPGRITTMTLSETLKQLKALGNEKMRAHNTKNGAGDNQFGVNLGDVREIGRASCRERV